MPSENVVPMFYDILELLFLELIRASYDLMVY